MITDRVSYLIRQYAGNNASDEELDELFSWIREHQDDEILQKRLMELAIASAPDDTYDAGYWEPFIKKAIQTDKQTARVIKWPRRAFAAAAAVLLLLAGGIAFWINRNGQQKQLAANRQELPYIGPGKDGAILTLSDGRRIILDSLKNGTITDQDEAAMHMHDGSLIYEAAAGKEVVWNTVTTPNGRQFRLELPDGTKVWLNAASSITYPTRFVGKERRVRITGEAYFETVTDRNMPMHVQAADGVDVEVLGTSFNINSYPDEPGLRTTLLSGSVRVAKEGHTSLLKPGQQVTIVDKQLKLDEHPNIGQVIAWKNGLFDFDHADLKTVMSQIARWYDMSIEYRGNLEGRSFKGKITRDLSLTQVLNVLQEVEVQFKIEGKTIIVTN